MSTELWQVRNSIGNLCFSFTLSSQDFRPLEYLQVLLNHLRNNPSHFIKIVYLDDKGS